MHPSKKKLLSLLTNCPHSIQLPLYFSSPNMVRLFLLIKGVSFRFSTLIYFLYVFFSISICCVSIVKVNESCRTQQASVLPNGVYISGIKDRGGRGLGQERGASNFSLLSEASFDQIQCCFQIFQLVVRITLHSRRLFS